MTEEVIRGGITVERRDAVTGEVALKLTTDSIPFTFDASGLAGKSVAVFESLYQDTLEVAVHADIEDEAQTVTVNTKGGLLIKKTAEDNFKTNEAKEPLPGYVLLKEPVPVEVGADEVRLSDIINEKGKISIAKGAQNMAKKHKGNILPAA